MIFGCCMLDMEISSPNVRNETLFFPLKYPFLFRRNTGNEHVSKVSLCYFLHTVRW